MNLMAVSTFGSNLSNKNGKISWLKAQSMRQSFCLPDSIIYYITKNPSTPEAYLKLVQSSKYFFEKKPILIVACIYDDIWKGIRICSNSRQECIIACQKCIKFDATKIISKIWLTSNRRLNTYCSSFIPISKLYRCENAKLTISHIQISEKRIQLLASKFSKFYFYNTVVLDADRKVSVLEKTLELIPNVKEFTFQFYDAKAAAASTLKNILKLQIFKKLRNFSLLNIPEVFNLKDLDEFIKSFKNSSLFLEFC